MMPPSTSKGVSTVVSRSQLGGLDRQKGVLKLLVSLLKLVSARLLRTTSPSD